ncbi:hypothetical protein HYS91_01425 [Candidatus Daviesbacteria bacterium]|nr:hypothetical protein [Candidatus Daviesbacteria bacterium]
MKLVYTKHAKDKFNHPSIIKFNIKRNNIKEAILRPDHYMENYELKVKIVLRKLNEDYNLRIIYSEVNGIITLVTFYPTRRGRYEK